MEVKKVEDGEPEINLRWGVWHTRNNVTNGTYKINVVTGICNAGSTIKVSNKKITSAYNQWMNGFAPGISISDSLAKVSSTQATYYMDFSMVGVFWSSGVCAKIQSGNLVTYWQ
ncbi:DUF5626 family protein [Enterococcus sp. DIV1314a]|uniref:DUF5626 family protein n=1 Tax=Enterococcus sp. DIV1314a TaxID=2774660 RepID=UPI003F68603B